MAKKAYIGVDGVAKKIKTGYLGISDYTAVEYIESSRTQYIDTGYQYANGDVVTLICSPLVETGDQVFFGSRSTSAYQVASILFGSWRFQYYLKTAYVVGQKYTITVEADGYWYIDGVSTGLSGNVQTGMNAYLFALNADPNVESGNRYPVEGRVWRFTVQRGGVLIHDFAPCVNANSEVGMYDTVNSQFRSNIGTGEFIAGAETGEVFGQGVARKTKKAYIGIGGVARPCWSSAGVEYWGTADDLWHYGMGYLAATKIGDYAVFAGGEQINSSFIITENGVRAYNSSLTKSTLEGMRIARSMLAATSVGDYALFAGGRHRETSAWVDSSDVEAYNSSLTKSTPTELSSARRELGGATVGNYALFAGGYVAGDGWDYDNVDAYDTELVRITAPPLAVARFGMAATTINDCALFAGGTYTSYSNIVEVYDKDLVKGTPTTLSVGRCHSAATTVNNYALFAGGMEYTNPWAAYNTVDVFDIDLTRIEVGGLSSARAHLAAATTGDYALFAGGYDGTNYYNTVDVYVAE